MKVPDSSFINIFIYIYIHKHHQRSKDPYLKNQEILMESVSGTFGARKLHLFLGVQGDWETVGWPAYFWEAGSK